MNPSIAYRSASIYIMQTETHEKDVLKDEKDFQVNLLRLAGVTSAVTVDQMLSTIAYINNQNVDEALVIEQSYLGNLFTNAEFMRVCCPISSLHHVIDCFLRAKRDNNDDSLRQFDSAHRLARQFLDDPEIKKYIKDLVTRRKKDIYFKACWKTVQMMRDLTQRFPREYLTSYWITTIGECVNQMSAIENRDTTDALER